MISAADRRRIAEAIAAAEQRTSGEIVCVLTQASSRYAALPILWSTIGALAAPWALVFATQFSVQRILLIQALVFAALLAVLSWPSIRVRLAPRALRRAEAHRSAMQQFVARGLTRTHGRTGVLIYVSLAERYVRIIPDEAMEGQTDQTVWQAAVDAMLAHLREQQIVEGFVAAIALCGETLAQHCPRKPDDRNELPNRIYVI
jgi:putative membrane protein